MEVMVEEGAGEEEVGVEEVVAVVEDPSGVLPQLISEI